jgi:DNA polymerase-3 subunit alpha
VTSIALTDEGSISGAIAFVDALKKTCVCGHHENSHHEDGCYGGQRSCQCPGKDKTTKSIQSAKIKPIIGSEFRIKQEEGKAPASIVVLAKNYNGWKALIAATSEANRVENIVEDKAYIPLDKLAELAKDGNLIAYSGMVGTDIANALFERPETLYLQNSYTEAKSLVSGKRCKTSLEIAKQYSDIFGKDNFYLTTQLLDKEFFFGAQVLTDAVRWISKETGIPCIATANTNYATPDDFDDQRILLCTDLETDYNNYSLKIAQTGKLDLLNFFKGKSYYMPSMEEISNLHEVDEIHNTLKIAEQCEAYKIFDKPQLPKFECPGGKHPDLFLKELCAAGWKVKIQNKVDASELYKYKDRIKEELNIITSVGLSSYFLIVDDYLKASVANGQMIGPGRGSSGGSLIAYLTNITDVDPIKYDLLFGRFYNSGRNTADRVSLPDIDSDVEDRDWTIEYVRNKYGRDRVSQMITFSRIQGKGSLKEVFRRKFPDTPISEVERITKSLPDESAISDKLQEMKEAGQEASIIMWSLEGHSKELKEFCYIDEQGRLQGEYATAFRQAIRLEGTKKSQGKHPSGIVISNDPLADYIPMIYDKSSKLVVAGLEMNDLEKYAPKFDILGLNTLSKLHDVTRMALKGNFN